MTTPSSAARNHVRNVPSNSGVPSTALSTVTRPSTTPRLATTKFHAPTLGRRAPRTPTPAQAVRLRAAYTRSAEGDPAAQPQAAQAAADQARACVSVVRRLAHQAADNGTAPAA